MTSGEILIQGTALQDDTFGIRFRNTLSHGLPCKHWILWYDKKKRL